VREAATICPRSLQVDLCPFDLDSDVRVTCDVGYLCAKFSIILSVLDLGRMYAKVMGRGHINGTHSYTLG